MPFSPLHLVLFWLTGPLSLAVVAVGVYQARRWWIEDGDDGSRLLWIAVALLLWSVAGKWLVLLFKRAGSDEPVTRRSKETRELARPDGTRLHVELEGPPAAPPIVLTHGWGGDSTTWFYQRRDLARTHRVIAWDLRGLGRSSKPDNGDYALETMADDLAAVLALAEGRPAILVGHSMGGMITQTFLRRRSGDLRRSVAAVVLVETTHTNPVRTMWGRRVFTALQRPIVEPLAHLLRWTAPLARLMSVSSYLNGTSHLVNALTSFGGRETRGQLDYATSYGPSVAHAVIARQLLAMLHWDATGALRDVDVPVLVIAGEGDIVTEIDASERIVAGTPGAQLRRLDRKTGHLSVLEAHGEVTEAIRAFANAAGRPRPHLRAAE